MRRQIVLHAKCCRHSWRSTTLVFRRVDIDKIAQSPHNVANTLWIESILSELAILNADAVGISAKHRTTDELGKQEICASDIAVQEYNDRVQQPSQRTRPYDDGTKSFYSSLKSVVHGQPTAKYQSVSLRRPHTCQTRVPGESLCICRESSP